MPTRPLHSVPLNLKRLLPFEKLKITLRSPLENHELRERIGVLLRLIELRKAGYALAIYCEGIEQCRGPRIDFGGGPQAVTWKQARELAEFERKPAVVELPPARKAARA